MILAALAATAGSGAWASLAEPARDAQRVPPVAKPSPAASSVAKRSGLSAEERDRVAAMLDLYAHAEARKATGSVTVQRHQAKIGVLYLADRSTGSGAIEIAGASASIILAGGQAYARADTAFWSALGVETTSSGWAGPLPQAFVDEVFPKGEDLVDQIRPDDSARLDGQNYTVRSTSAVLGGIAGVQSIQTPDAELDFAAADPQDVTTAVNNAKEEEGTWPPSRPAAVATDDSGALSVTPLPPPPSVVQTPVWRPPARQAPPPARHHEDHEDDGDDE